MADGPLIVQEMHPETSERAEALSFGQAGLAFATVLALVALDSLDGLLWWAVLVFAATVPLGIGHALLCRDWSSVPFSTPGWRRVSATISTATHLSMFAGVVLIFSHVSVWHASVFALVSLGSWFVWRRQTRLLHSVAEARREGRLHPAPGTPEQ